MSTVLEAARAVFTGVHQPAIEDDPAQRREKYLAMTTSAAIGAVALSVSILSHGGEPQLRAGVPGQVERQYVDPATGDFRLDVEQCPASTPALPGFDPAPSRIGPDCHLFSVTVDEGTYNVHPAGSVMTPPRPNISFGY